MLRGSLRKTDMFVCLLSSCKGGAQALNVYKSPGRDYIIIGIGILKIINFYHTAAGPGMGMWVDERGRKVSESFSNLKIGQIEG